MNTSHFSRRIFLALLLTLGGFVTDEALARPVHARELQAVVQSIDFRNHTLTLANPQPRGPRTFVWKNNTPFLRNRKFVTAGELKEGTRVTAYFHSPFVGKPMVTKIVWRDRN